MRVIPKPRAVEIAEIETVLARLGPGEVRPRLERLNWTDQKTGLRYELDRNYNEFRVFVIS